MTDSETETEAQEELDYERYAAAREAANALSADQSKFIDQTILTFGGGGLGITLTFLHDFVTVPVAPPLLYLGDGFLIVSILAVLVSLYTSQKSISAHIKDLDDAARNDFSPEHTKFMKAPYINPSAKLTARLNLAAIVSVTLGMILLATFVSLNLTRKEPHKMTKDIETKIIHPAEIEKKGLVIQAPAVAPKPAPVQQTQTPQPAPKE